MLKGWLKIPGVQEGERSLDEQMLGLTPALLHVRGKTVLDLGCAEGLIGLEFAKAGAVVRGLELQQQYVDIGNRLAVEAGVAKHCRFAKHDLSDLNQAVIPASFPCPDGADIVLALAIVHKLREPGRALRNMARLARQRLVIRLPIGSEGHIACKYDGAKSCDSHRVMYDAGFTLEQTQKGPRGERVQHWVRVFERNRDRA
jgi:SAM-dependent methyltransferase